MYLFDTSNHIRRPYNTEIGIHANRLKTLFMYHDMLPGNCSNVNDENDPAQIRKRELALFRSFPLDWQGDFINLQNDLANDDNIAWKDIVSWMTQKKRTVDRKKLMQESSQRRARPGNRTGGRGLQQNRFGGGHGHVRPSYGFQPYPRTRTLQDILKGIHKVFNVEAVPTNKIKDDFNQEAPTMVAEAVDSMASAVDAPKLVAFSQDETIKAEANNSNNRDKTTMLSRTTIKKLKALLRKAAFLNGTKTMSYGGMPSAKQYQHQEHFYQAEENQQQWNNQFNFEQEEYYPEEQEAQENFSYDEDSPFLFHEDRY
ncbi:unnamed protein product [Cylindrotheca closterium]|uniref:Uncharacterized protein n=1 Tax=Cylindrotheca closterium TaxID=2856 RepID=A0AAD2FDD0_9STRA|nr:unnamed protein product [Cylindrotheca closterium]